MSFAAAFAAPSPLPVTAHSIVRPRLSRCTTPCSHPRRYTYTPRASFTGNPSSSSSSQQQQQQQQGPQNPPPSLFVEDDGTGWDASSDDMDRLFAPLSSTEEEILRARLPRRLADFFVGRASDAVRLRTPDLIFRDLRRDTPDPDPTDPVNMEYNDYVYVTTTTAPGVSFKRRGSSLFGGGDALPTTDAPLGEPYMDESGAPVIRPVDNPQKVEGERSDPRVVSLFVGQVDSVDEQASRLGYGILAILAFSFVLKLVFAVISFFLSFTFSFFAIFALSAGIFVLFFLIRF